MLVPLLVLVAAAQPAGGAIAAKPDVEIAIAAPAPAAKALREDLEDLLSRQGVAARYRLLPAVDRDEVLRPGSEAPCALACLWIDLGVAKPTRALVYISATAAEQVVIRSLPLPGGVDEVAREEVAHIVASSVEALQAGRPLPAATNLADAPLAKTVRAPAIVPAAPRTRWLVGVGGGAAHEGAAHLAMPMVGASLVVGSDRGALPALWVALGAFWGDEPGDPVSLRFRGGELAALGTVATRDAVDGRPRRVVARLGVGPGLELRSATPTSTASSGATNVTVDAARVDASVFARAAARLEVRLSDSVDLFLSAACDARFVRHRYTIDRDGAASALYQPDVLRPSVLVGLDARLGGETRP